MPQRLVSSNVRLGIAIVVLCVLLVGSVAGSYALSLHAIRQSQGQWCDTLSLLTANAHPTTPQGQQFYTKLRALEVRFGC